MAITQKYWFYIDFGTGYEEVVICNNNLKLEHRVDKDWEAIIHKEIVGDFTLGKEYYDVLEANFLDSGNTDLPFKVYRDGNTSTGTLIFTGAITEFSDYDSKLQQVKIKSIICTETAQVAIQNVIRNLDYTCKYYNLLTLFDQYEIYDPQFWIGELVTEFAYRFVDVFNNCLNNGDVSGGYTYLNPSGDVWFDTPAIDITKLRLCDIPSLRKNSTDIIGGAFKELKVSDLLGLMRDLFKSFWYLSGNYLKFKTPNDLISNTYNASTLITHMQNKVYDYGFNFKKEVLKLHPNTYLDFSAPLDVDWASNELLYDRNSDKKVEINQEIFMTRYLRSDKLSYDGWFLGYVNTITNYLEVETGKASLSAPQTNGKLCPANILFDYYQNYMYTKRGNYTLFGIPYTSDPDTFMPFISMQSFAMVISNPEVFIDSFIYKEDDDFNYISRVYKQSTDLNSNITTFEHYDFTKQAK